MNRNIFIWVLAGLALSVFLVSNAAEALTARQIMEKVDSRDDGDNMIADMEMILIDKSNRRRVRRMKSFRKDKGQDTLRLMFFLEPADVRDTSFLTHDYHEADKEDDQWIYLPALRKVKRIASSDKSSAFMGSDFSYADMTKRAPENYDFKLIKEMEVRGRKVWLSSPCPAPSRLSINTGTPGHGSWSARTTSWSSGPSTGSTKETS